MAHTSVHGELLKTQQQTIASFVESSEEISENFKLVQSLLRQQSCASSKSLQEQVESIIVNERQNASRLQVLEEIHSESMATAEEKQCFLEEAQLNLPTLQKSATESESWVENYRARPKTTCRVD